jgi:hypothetical protein
VIAIISRINPAVKLVFDAICSLQEKEVWKKEEKEKKNEKGVRRKKWGRE